MYLNQTAAAIAIVLGVFLISAAAAMPVQAQEAPQQVEPEEPVRTVKEYNLPERSTLAIKGYDPVGYFPEGDPKKQGAPIKGLESIEYTYKGVAYRFATKENLQQFKKDPARYEPAYGGWCAWAMADGKKAAIDPKKFIVKDGRLFLFYNGFANDTRDKWLKKDHKEQASAADAEWKKLTGELPRIPKTKETPETPDNGDPR